MTLEDHAARIRRITEEARTEAALQVKLEGILADLLKAVGIDHEPAVNESLRSQGISQSDSARPDSLFGHVVLDYKAPRLLSSPRELGRAKTQIEEYLQSTSFLNEPQKWAGVLWDGASLCFCHSDGVSWRWSRRHETSPASLLTLIGLYRSLSRKPLTATLLARAFGKESADAQTVLTLMCGLLAKPRHRTTMLHREWKRRFEQVSTYGLDQLESLRSWARSLGIATKDASTILFAVHSYYALVVKLLTSELLSAISPLNTESAAESIANAKSSPEVYAALSALEDGEFWRRYRISNFLEGDFFSWYTSERSAPLAEAIQALARSLMEFEPATVILKPEAMQDLLKEFYTTLVDEQLRHDLGEYYTPDWLAQYVLDLAGYSGDPDAVVLDPACGSGTFLVECISRIRRRAESGGEAGVDTLRAILRSVRGLDLNPLAVISARANLVLAIADLIFSTGDDVELPVYLADCINVPQRRTAKDGLAVFEFTLDTEVGRFLFEVPAALVEAGVLGQVLLICEESVRTGRSPEHFLKRVRQLPELEGLLDAPTVDRLIGFYSMVAALEEKEWDRIWCRVIKNSFSPSGFGGADLIVGNPPWVRWSRLPQSYRERVKDRCASYGLVSGRGYSGGIESDISTVVLYSAVDQWLRDGGRIAFLMTWTVFKSASARGFRLGKLPDSGGIRVDRIADLTALQPFPDATNETAVYLATRVADAREAVFERVSLDIWRSLGSSRIDPRAELETVRSRAQVTEGIACPVGDWGTPLWTGGRAEYEAAAGLKGRSDYLKASHRGTISDLARVYWVKVERYSAKTNRALIRTLTEAELPKAQTIDPVEGAWIEAELLHPLARGRDLGRYCCSPQGWYQIIPNRHYENVASEDEFAERYPCAYSYFCNYRELLLRRSTYKRYQKHLPFYVIYCVGDYSFGKWKVAWMEQQLPGAFRCAVLPPAADGLSPNPVIVPDHKLYFAGLEAEDEAHFLCAYLNSMPVRSWLGGFLHGKQIGTTIFEFMHVPRFCQSDKRHRRLVEISRTAHLARANTRNEAPLPTPGESELAELVRQIASTR